MKLARPWSPLILASLAMALSLPALNLGLQLDDQYLRLALSDPPIDPAWSRPATDVFGFFRGDPEFTRAARDRGTVPWWADERLKLAFFRPLSGLTHGLDFRLWPRSPWLMHLQSLLWLGACVAVAALLYRRLGLSPAVAGLAGLAFALDDAHGTPAAWIANRNAMVASLFGLLCLLAHHRWRSEGWRPGAVLAPVLLLLGLLGGEMAVATGGYLLGYALFLDRGTSRQRALSLAPGTAVGIGWALAYRALGYGARHSGLYVDPVGNPLEFARALVERAPLLFFGQWALPADLQAGLSVSARHAFWLGAVALFAAVAVLLAPLLRADRTARFFATGMLLALVPASATFVSIRLLFMAGFGGAGLLAQWLVGTREAAGWVPGAAPWRRLARLAFWPAIVVHFVVAPLGLLGASAGVRMLGDVGTRLASSLPRDGAVAGQHVLIVNTPSAFISAQGWLVAGLEGRPFPERAHVLGSGLGPIDLQRPDATTLVVRPRGGYLAAAGSVSRTGSGPPAVFDQHYLLGMFDRLYRGADPFRPGDRIPLAGLAVEVRSVTADGRPDAVAFRFERPLDDAGYRWLQWRDGEYAPFEPPSIGAARELPAVVVWP